MQVFVVVKRELNDTIGVMGNGGWYSMNVATEAGFLTDNNTLMRLNPRLCLEI